MKISLVLTSFDRVEDLKRFFLCLSNQVMNGITCELIFVNQGNIQLEEIICHSGNVVIREIKTTRLSLSRARNIGLKEVTGDVIGFPDDDCWYSNELLKQIGEYFIGHQKTDVVCTNVYDPISSRSYGGRPVNLNVSISVRNLFQFPISVGIFVRRSALEIAGFYFDENYGAGTSLGSGEETDLIYRLLKTGSHVEYAGVLQVYHPVPVYQPNDAAKYYRYGLGFGFLNGRIMLEGQWGVIPHFAYVLFRSLGGCFRNIHKSTQRNLYWNRFLGICIGAVSAIRGKSC